MKRVLSLLLTIAMAAQLLVVPAFAEEAQNGIAVLSSAEVAHGEVAELTLSLQDFENATSIAVKVHSELEVFGYTWSEVFAYDLCDFDYNKKQGVWATPGEDAIDVNRTVAIMSFIVPDEQVTDPTISCDVVVEIDGVRHTVSTSGTITVKHAYGEWYETKEATLGEAGEEQRDCAVCDAYETRVIPVLEAVAMVGEKKFVTLKEAVEFVQTIPEENRDNVPVLVLKDCEIPETIVISNGRVSVSSDAPNTTRQITAADTAFEIQTNCGLMFSDGLSGSIVNLVANGSSAFELTGANASMQVNPTTISGAADVAISMNADGQEVVVYGASIDSTAAGAVAFSMNGDSKIGLYGVRFNDVDYYDPHQAPYAVPNSGAVARVDTCYYGALETALEAAAEVKYPGDGAENFLTPITLLSDTSVDTDMTLDANHPVKLNLTNHTLTVANGTEFTVAQETELHNGTLRVGYGGELAGAEKIREIKNNDEIGKIRYEVALTALVNGKSTDTVKVGDAADVTVRANRAADKTVTDIATAYTIIKDEETPVGSAQNLTDEAGTYIITPKLADEEIRYEVVDELTQSAKLVVKEEIGELIPNPASDAWRMELDGVVYLRYYPILKGFADDFDFANRCGIVQWTGTTAPTSRYQIEVGKENTKVIHGMTKDTEGKWYFRSDEIYAKNLGKKVYIRPYVQISETEYVYMDGAPNHSAAWYCYDMMSSLKNRADTRALCGALLQYGASAQIYFNEDTEHLVTDIPSGPKAGSTIWESIDWADYDLAYKSSYLNMPIKHTPHVLKIANSMGGNKTGVIHDKVNSTSTLELVGAIRLLTGFEVDENVVDMTQVEKAEVLYWSAKDIEAAESLDYALNNQTYKYSLELATGKLTEFGEYIGRSHYIVAKDLGEIVYGYCRIELKDGSVYRSGLVAYSPEAFVYDHLSNNKPAYVDTLCERIAVYSEMARIRFYQNK